MSIKKKIIIVLGTGRSGTSLMMQILKEFGVDYSEDVIAGDESNPKGHLEDARIVNLQRNFLLSLNQGNENPFITEKDLHSKKAQTFKKELEKELIKKIHNDTSVFAIKDPRISILLPFWQEILSKYNVEVFYLFAYRHPSSIINSLGKYYDITELDSQWLWLHRIISAFYFTHSKVLVVDYEKWFSSGVEQLKKIIKYLNLDDDYLNKTESIIRNVVSEKLNRAFSDKKISNYEINNIHHFIKSEEFKNLAIRKRYFEQKYKTMQSFLSWTGIKINYYNNKIYGNMKEIKQLTDTIQQKETEIKQLTDTMQQEKIKMEQLTSLLKEKNDIIDEKNKHIIKLENSKSFQIGNLFFRSMRNPYKFVTFPINIIRILFGK